MSDASGESSVDFKIRWERPKLINQKNDCTGQHCEVGGCGNLNVAVKSQKSKRDFYTYVGWIVLVAYVLLLGYSVVQYGDNGTMSGFSLLKLQGSGQILKWCKGLLLECLYEFFCYALLGLMVTWVVSHHSVKLGRFPIRLQALIAASLLVVLLYALKRGRSWHFAATMGLGFPMLGCLLGTWIGTTWLRGRQARLWLLSKIALFLSVATLFGGIILFESLEKKPLSFEAARVTSAEKRRLVKLIRSKSPRALTEGQIHTVRLTGHDINVLLSWGLSLGSPDRKAKVGLSRDSASLSVSAGITLGDEKTRYLNLEMNGTSQVEEGVVRLDIHRCKFGSLRVPRWLLRLLSPVVGSWLNHDRLSKPLMDAIEAVSIEPDSIVVTYGPVDMPAGFREAFFGPASASAEILASTRAQVNNLLSVVGQSSLTQSSFGMCFETVFSFARERSVERDPILENRAAIFALGILLGHPRIEEFLGPVLDGCNNGPACRILRRVPLRGRSDWTNHFCVSAAITLLSDEVLSDAVGLLKEELDADMDGSGFSFADLLAERAGTAFALQAIHNENSARALQDRIAGGFRVDDFFPPAADLPEGIPDAELQTYYGGVGGETYNRYIEQIERRVAACAAY